MCFIRDWSCYFKFLLCLVASNMTSIEFFMVTVCFKGAEITLCWTNFCLLHIQGKCIGKIHSIFLSRRFTFNKYFEKFEILISNYIEMRLTLLCYDTYPIDMTTSFYYSLSIWVEFEEFFEIILKTINMFLCFSQVLSTKNFYLKTQINVKWINTELHFFKLTYLMILLWKRKCNFCWIWSYLNGDVEKFLI